MKVRALLALAVLLAAALAWLALRGEGPATQPIAASRADSTGTEAVAPLTDAALDRGRRAALQTAMVAATETVPVAQAPSDEQRVALHGFIRPPPGVKAMPEGASITVTNQFGRRKSADASKEGFYSISALEPGKYSVWAGTDDGGQAKARIRLSLEDSPKRFDITLQQTTTLLVKVTDGAGNSLKERGLNPLATMAMPAEWIDDTSGTPNELFGVGRFDSSGSRSTSSNGEYLGQFTFDVPMPVFVSIVHYQRVIATQQVLPGQTEVTFILDLGSPLLQTGSLRAHFVSKDGVGLPDVLVILEGGGFRPVPPSSSLFVEGLKPGRYQLTARSKGFEQRVVPVRIEAGIERDLGDVVLQPEVWISGRIRDWQASASQERFPRAGFRCDLYDPTASGEWQGRSIFMHAIQDDGSFKILGLTRGLYLMKWMATGSSDSTWTRLIDTREGPVEGLDVELVDSVSLVFSSSIENWSSVQFRVLDQDGTVLVASRLRNDAPHPVELAPGDYEVEVRVGSGDPIRKPVRIGNDRVEIDIP